MKTSKCTPPGSQGERLQGFQFDLEGNMTGVPYIIDPPVTRTILERTQATLGSPVTACNFQHEHLVARHMSEPEFTRMMTEGKAGVWSAVEKYRQLTATCLCPLAVRRGRPVCAHVENFRPDPFGPNIRELISLLILRRKPWQKWHKKMTARIDSADGKVAAERYTLHGLSREWPAELQAPIVAELEHTRLMLLRCVQNVLEELPTTSSTQTL